MAASMASLDYPENFGEEHEATIVIFIDIVQIRKKDDVWKMILVRKSPLERILKFTRIGE